MAIMRRDTLTDMAAINDGLHHMTIRGVGPYGGGGGGGGLDVPLIPQS